MSTGQSPEQAPIERPNDNEGEVAEVLEPISVDCLQLVHADLFHLLQC